MRGACLEVCTSQLLTEVVGGVGSEARDFDALVADFAQPAKHLCELVPVVQSIADGVELGSDHAVSRQISSRLDSVSRVGMYSSPIAPLYPARRNATSCRGQSIVPVPGS